MGLSRALVQEGAQVTVVAPHDKNTASKEIIDGVEVRRFSYWWPKNAQGLCYGAGIPTNVRQNKSLIFQFPVLEAAFMMAALRYGGDADVYNAHWTFAALPTVLLSKLNRKPIVTTAYSAEYVPPSLHPINRLIVRNSRAVISISNFTRDVVETVVHPRYHEVIGLGVNPEKIAPPDFDRQSFRTSKNIEPDETLVLAIGRLVKRKGFPVLIDSIAQLVNQGKKIKLFLAGKGPEQAAIQSQIATLGIGSSVNLLGFVPDSDLRLYLKASDILVMPSIADEAGDTEGLGIPLLEAMANETPVIGSAIGGILDIVENEKTGLLVPPQSAEALVSAIQRLVDDDALRHRIVQGGYELVNTRFSWQTIARQTLEVFSFALQKKSALAANWGYDND